MKNLKLYIVFCLLLAITTPLMAQTSLSVTDTDKNWTSVNRYDVNGKVIGASVGFYDNLGRATQSQSFDPKTGKNWASEILYDQLGRPALQTLSAPISTNSNFSYKTGFIKKSNNTDFGLSDFENANLDNPSVVGAYLNTLGWYYSTSNTSEPYQDVTSRPYSRTIYSELNPGTALKTIGGNKMNGEWKNGYVFSMPVGQELSQPQAFDDIRYNNYKIVKTVSRDIHGIETVVFTDTDGRTLATARSGNEEGGITNTRTSFIKIRNQGYVDIHIPVGRTGAFISDNNEITLPGNPGTVLEIYDLITEKIVTTPLKDLPNGFYRISIKNLAGYVPGSISVTYPENYYDYSLNYYDKAGRLVSSKQPLNKLESTFTYNSRGQLKQTHSPDEGDAAFRYRRDGQIRFSQNSKQLAAGEFSYTNYDHRARPIESGVIISDAFQTTDVNGNLPSGTRKEQHITTYDIVTSSDISALPTNYKNPSFLAGNVAKTSNENTTTYYSYDIYGRVQWIVQNITDLGIKTIDYEYDPITSQVNKVLYQKGKTDQFIHKYTYDADNYSLTKVETSTNGNDFTEHAAYTYYETGALKSTNIANKLQGIDYVYNLNGALKSINNPNAANDPGNVTGSMPDLFGMNIHYYNGDYTRSNTPKPIATTTNGIDQYNGNIKATTWNTKGQNNNAADSYYYKYNKNNWLQGASFNQNITGPDPTLEAEETRSQTVTASETVEATNGIYLKPGFGIKATTSLVFGAKIDTGVDVNGNGDYNVSGITYDANGNIKKLNRNKGAASGSNAMDKLSYTYKTDKPNQLLRVDDAVGSVTGADDIEDQDGNNYEYNDIGQLIKNNEENIAYLYNASGLVTEVKKGNQPAVKFFYNDKGHRVRKEAYNLSNGNLSHTEYYVRDAAGTAMAIYRKQGSTTNLLENTIYGASRLGVRKSDGTRLYQLTDHLGNVRAVVGRTPSGQAMAMTSATDYYPGGMAMPGRDLKSDYRYGYQGEFAETDPETGKPAFELRLYDPRINRWLTTDPYGEFTSPYLAMGNNWISNVDPDGGCVSCGISTEDGINIASAVQNQLNTVYLTGSGKHHSNSKDIINTSLLLYSVSAGATGTINDFDAITNALKNNTFLSREFNGAGKLRSYQLDPNTGKALLKGGRYKSPDGKLLTFGPEDVTKSANSFKTKVNLIKGVKAVGVVGNVAGVGLSVHQIYIDGEVTPFAGADTLMGAVAFIPGVGWVLSSGWSIARATIPPDYSTNISPTFHRFGE